MRLRSAPKDSLVSGINVTDTVAQSDDSQEAREEQNLTEETRTEAEQLSDEDSELLKKDKYVTVSEILAGPAEYNGEKLLLPGYEPDYVVSFSGTSALTGYISALKVIN